MHVCVKDRGTYLIIVADLSSKLKLEKKTIFNLSILVFSVIRMGIRFLSDVS